MRVGLAVLGFLLLCLIVSFCVAQYLKRREEKWEQARHNAKWEDYATTQHGETQVGVRLVAALGRKRRVIREEVLQYISCAEKDWMVQVHAAQFEAKNHANVLNEA